MQKIRTGVVGLGAIGANHARIMAELPNAEFAAVFDERREHAEALAEQYGTTAASSLEELIDQSPPRRAEPGGAGAREPVRALGMPGGD